MTQRNKIGHKGLGFRSILSWSNKAIIYSGGVAVAFSQTIARKFLTTLIAENPEIDTFLQGKSPVKYPIATLRIPHLLEEDEIQAWKNDYDTHIIIKLKSDIVGEVQTQIENTINKETLVFLNNVECIEIDSPRRRAVFRKTYLNPDKTQVRVESIINGETTVKTWHLSGLKGTHRNKNYELAIAWNEELDDRQNVVFSYFRTEVRFPFPALLHGTFELSPDRNQLVKDVKGHNKFLTNKLAELLVNTAREIASHSSQVSYLPLQLLNIEFSKVDSIFQEFNLEEVLLKKIKEQEVFPTVNNKYISYEDEPVFYTNPIADILSGEDVDNLLLYTEDKKIINLLDEIDIYHYLAPSFMVLLQTRMNQLSIAQYAELYYYFIYRYSDDIKKMNKKELQECATIFFDTNKTPIEWDSSIFLLPENGRKFRLPKLKIHFLHPDFTKELLAYYEDYEDDMLEDLNLFGIKEYSFQEVAKTLISHYQDLLTDVEQVLALHSYLFPLYKNEKRKDPEKLGIPVPVITHNKKIKNAGEVYFGIKYGNDITNRLYSYDKSKFLASPEIFGFDEDEEIIISYFAWLGVAFFPRRIEKDAEEEFKKYAMRNYDFKTRKDDTYFSRYKNYNDFKNNLNWYNTSNVRSVDELDHILQHNSSETILTWLSLDTELYPYLEKDIEPTTSYISFYPYNAQYSRRISGKEVKSYLKWYLSRQPWMRTQQRTQREPAICTTSETISADFSPLIEKVNVDYSALVFRKNNITRDKVDYLLLLVGVNKTISSFPTNTLYSILKRLPEIDPEGKKAKSIYKELAVNYEDRNLDESEKQYKEFIANGSVFCKKHNTYSYEQISNVYYVENKRYGESIINQFHTIEIDKRRGVKKIRKLFGVEPLKDIKITLRNEPETHPLNSVFEQDLEAFKPYIYVLRQETDVHGQDKRRIKETKFKLVLDLSIELEKSEIPEVDLDDYEYVYLPKKKTIYIKTPDSLKENLEELKDDIEFCDIVSEAFSSLIDVESQRQQIRELYSKSPTKRDDIIRAELDDDRLEKLALAREKLGVVNDPVIQFWGSFLKCFPKKRLKGGRFTEQQLVEELQTLFPVYKDIIGQVFPQIDYTHYNEESSVRIILEFLKATGMSLAQFNHYLYPTLDISEVYTNDFVQIKSYYQPLFKQWLYLRYQQSDKEKIHF